MISKKQYLRLTLVLALPLLVFGLWLAENEEILPSPNVIYCREFDSNITCNSLSVSKNDANKMLYQNSAVRLWGAVLEGGFNHSVITLGNSEIKFIDGKPVRLPPVGGGVKKILSFAPKSTQKNIFSSCEIYPDAVGDNNWGHSCTGEGPSPGGFYFADEKTSQKFKTVKDTINEQRKNNETMRIRGIFVTTLLPLTFYLFVSLVIFILVKISRYIVYGRTNERASVD